MFVGHYALGFAARKINRGPSLGTFFMAAQWPDLVWPILLLLRVERVTIQPGNTVLTPLNFVSYPWSHSMLMAIVWGILFSIIYYTRTKNRNASFILLFIVYSHWVLDWIAHRPDLQLAPFSEIKLGLGLWNHKWAELIIESGIFVIFFISYMKGTIAKNKTGSLALWCLVSFMLLIYIMSAFGPAPQKVSQVAWAGLAQWLFVAWGYWVDKNRA